jgi:hypothetical protein
MQLGALHVLGIPIAQSKIVFQALVAQDAGEPRHRRRITNAAHLARIVFAFPMIFGGGQTGCIEPLKPDRTRNASNRRPSHTHLKAAKMAVGNFAELNSARVKAAPRGGSQFRPK